MKETSIKGLHGNVDHKIIESQEKGQQKKYELKHFTENIDHRTTISHKKTKNSINLLHGKRRQ